MTPHHPFLRLLAAAAFSLAAGAAVADAIDGDWCAPNDTRSFHITGPRIVTPSGRETAGDYSRHAFSYVIPEGDPGAGGTVNMRLLNENTVSVGFDPAQPETWHRCDLSV